MYIANKLVACSMNTRELVPKYDEILKADNGYIQTEKVIATIGTLLLGELFKTFITDKGFEEGYRKKYYTNYIENARYELYHRVLSVRSIRNKLVKPVEEITSLELINEVIEYILYKQREGVTVKEFKTLINGAFYRECEEALPYLESYIQYLLKNNGIYNNVNYELLGYIGAYNEKVSDTVQFVETWCSRRTNAEEAEEIKSIKDIENVYKQEVLAYMFGKYIKTKDIEGLVTLNYLKTVLRDEKVVVH